MTQSFFGGGKMDKFQPKVVLCPTDFSDAATFALQYAKVMAGGFQARLVVLYAEAFEPPPYFTSAQENDLLKSLKRSRKTAGAYLARYAKTILGESPEAESLVVDNLAVPAILQTAEQKNVDLIVMGTHGRSGWSRFMLGSVTERVLRETDRPVLTVRHKKGTLEPSASFIRKVLCPVNYTEVALLALEHAAAIAECFSADLRVLNVLESPSGDKMEEGEMDRLCAWVPQELRPRCELKEIVRRGEPAEQIIEVAVSLGCDLLAIGAQHKRFFDSTVIGTTTTRVIQNAPCPVLTVVRK
jgi:nucleotide-binding universal stress UspA family protein